MKKVTVGDLRVLIKVFQYFDPEKHFPVIFAVEDCVLDKILGQHFQFFSVLIMEGGNGVGVNGVGVE